MTDPKPTSAEEIAIRFCVENFDVSGYHAINEGTCRNCAPLASLLEQAEQRGRDAALEEERQRLLRDGEAAGYKFNPELSISQIELECLKAELGKIEPWFAALAQFMQQRIADLRRQIAEKERER